MTSHAEDARAALNAAGAAAYRWLTSRTGLFAVFGAGAAGSAALIATHGPDAMLGLAAGASIAGLLLLVAGPLVDRIWGRIQGTE